MKTIGSVLFLSFLILILLVSCEKSSSDWVKYYKDEDGTENFYKKGSIEKERDRYIVQVWVRSVFSDKGKEEKSKIVTKYGVPKDLFVKQLSEQTMLEEIDCKKQRVKILSIIWYNSDGKELLSHTYDEDEWDYIPPDTYSDTLRKEVCK